MTDKFLAAPGAATITLHWLVAIGIIAMILFGLVIAATPSGPEKSALVPLHKSFGMMVGAIALARILLLWRTGFSPPAAVISDAKRRAARATQVLMLVCTIVMPLTGIAKSVTYARSVDVFGLTVVPKLLSEKNEGLNELASIAHAWTAWLLIALIVAHAAAALHHHFVLRDQTLARMLGARSARPAI
jgi:cytochrome b561